MTTSECFLRLNSCLCRRSQSCIFLKVSMCSRLNIIFTQETEACVLFETKCHLSFPYHNNLFFVTKINQTSVIFCVLTKDVVLGCQIRAHAFARCLEMLKGRCSSSAMAKGPFAHRGSLSAVTGNAKRYLLHLE